MIRNEFVYELDINLDLDYITKLVLKKQDETVKVEPVWPDIWIANRDGFVKGKTGEHRSALDDPYMASIQQKYPLLSPVYNIYIVPAKIGIPLHIDKIRSCALNIPIQGTKGTDTIFYDSVESPAIEKFRHTLIRPLLINNGPKPHEVTNNKDTMRITLNWSLNKGVTYEQAIEHFK